VELSLSTYVLDGHTVVQVGGEIDVYTAPKLRERIAKLIDGGATRLIVDLDHVGFFDSTGCGVVVGAHRRARARGGSCSFVIKKESLLKIFRITGLDRVLDIYRTLPDALAGARDKPPPGKQSTTPTDRPTAPVDPPARRGRSWAKHDNRTAKALDHGSNLTEAQKNDLIEIYISGQGIYDLAEMFSVSDITVWKLLREQGLGPAQWP